VPFNPRTFFRKAHRWGAVLVAAPFLLVILSGLLLQVKKQVPWVQPPVARGASKGPPAATFDAILAAARSVPEAGVSGWADIDRVDLRPKDGVAKVVCHSRWEVQVDAATGRVLQVEYRRSDLIESLHDGSFFGDGAKLAVFLPAGAVVLGLWLTGVYLFVLPYSVRWRRRNPSPSPSPKRGGGRTHPFPRREGDRGG
jgi:uncharacterized iron-regulated membrane protein